MMADLGGFKFGIGQMVLTESATHYPVEGTITDRHSGFAGNAYTLTHCKINRGQGWEINRHSDLIRMECELKAAGEPDTTLQKVRDLAKERDAILDRNLGGQHEPGDFDRVCAIRKEIRELVGDEVMA